VRQVIGGPALHETLGKGAKNQNKDCTETVRGNFRGRRRRARCWKNAVGQANGGYTSRNERTANNMVGGGRRATRGRWELRKRRAIRGTQLWPSQGVDRGPGKVLARRAGGLSEGASKKTKKTTPSPNSPKTRPPRRGKKSSRDGGAIKRVDCSRTRVHNDNSLPKDKKKGKDNQKRYRGEGTRMLRQQHSENDLQEVIGRATMRPGPDQA